MGSRIIRLAAYLCAVCSPLQASDQLSASSIIEVKLSRYLVTKVSGNTDGIYAGGSHLQLGSALLIQLGNDRSFKWGRTIPCKIQSLQALPQGGMVTIGRCGKRSARKIIAVGPSVLRFDSHGNLVWARTLLAGKGTRLRNLSADINGDIYVSGYIPQPSLTRSDTIHLDAFVMRLTDTGHIKWSRTFVTDKNSRGTNIGALEALSEGRIAMTLADKLVTLDADGTVLGAHEVHLNGVPLALRYMSHAVDRLQLTGTLKSHSARGLDVWVVTVNPSAQVHWAHMLNAGASDQVWAVTGAPNSITTIAGNTRRMGPTLEDKVHRRDGWLIRIGRHGEIVGSFTVGYDGDDSLYAVGGNSAVLALTGNIDDGNTGRRLLAFNPHLSSLPTGKCLAVKKITTKVKKLNVATMPSAVTLKNVKIAGDWFKPKIESVVPEIRDLCAGVPQPISP